MYHPIFLVLLIDLIAITVAVLIFSVSGEKMLGESSFLTHLSGAQLLAISAISFLIFRNRNQGVDRVFSLRNSRIVWGLIAAGFFYLMADELFKIHERIDEEIHEAFITNETGFTDRIDDVLILLYAFVGLAVIAVYRGEFVLMRRGLPLLATGFALLFLMVGLDVVTNRDDILSYFFEGRLATVLHVWLSFAEEGAKVLSEGFFIVAFYFGLEAARAPGRSQLTQATC